MKFSLQMCLTFSKQTRSFKILLWYLLETRERLAKISAVDTSDTKKKLDSIGSSACYLRHFH